jgi:hypothetical protein
MAMPTNKEKIMMVLRRSPFGMTTEEVIAVTGLGRAIASVALSKMAAYRIINSRKTPRDSGGGGSHFRCVWESKPGSAETERMRHKRGRQWQSDRVKSSALCAGTSGNFIRTRNRPQHLSGNARCALNSGTRFLTYARNTIAAVSSGSGVEGSGDALETACDGVVDPASAAHRGGGARRSLRGGRQRATPSAEARITLCTCESLMRCSSLGEAG